MINHGYASSTPVCDGRAVYMFFGRTGAFAYSMEGDLLWKADLGDGTHEFGTAASPIFFGDFVIINASVESGALVALDKTSGKTVWRSDKIRPSWSTPVLLEPEPGRPELILNIAKKVLAFDPATGKQLWTCAYPGDVAFGSVTVEDDMVYVSGGNNGRAVAAIRGGGRGDVTDTHKRWQITKASKIPTILVHDGLLYCVTDGGVIRCLRPESGEVVYEERLRLYPWASPVLADNKVYVAGKNRVLVLKAGPKFQMLAENELHDKSRLHATPAVDGNRLIVRSERFLYCFEK
jgi:outer membrane protein assembly factor BamB